LSSSFPNCNLHPSQLRPYLDTPCPRHGRTGRATASRAEGPSCLRARPRGTAFTVFADGDQPIPQRVRNSVLLRRMNLADVLCDQVGEGAVRARVAAANWSLPA